mgnify:CR=1 FL=1
MKLTKKILSISVVVLFIGVAAFNVHMNAEQNQSQNQTSQVTLQNIAALTSSAGEGSESCNSRQDCEEGWIAKELDDGTYDCCGYQQNHFSHS